ncbi:hypothetical protein TIFTF001_027026 [Ficus carica]|uniref:Uncharacterized protein n=1 Tax=Ficus carica TaxID=3494 RepID=A0AA88DMA2_FICCA|nr:hypothetical protein TIFTF001_027026 [Ficus carica]
MLGGRTPIQPVGLKCKVPKGGSVLQGLMAACFRVRMKGIEVIVYLKRLFWRFSTIGDVIGSYGVLEKNKKTTGLKEECGGAEKPEQALRDDDVSGSTSFHQREPFFSSSSPSTTAIPQSYRRGSSVPPSTTPFGRSRELLLCSNGNH